MPCRAATPTSSKAIACAAVRSKLGSAGRAWLRSSPALRRENASLRLPRPTFRMAAACASCNDRHRSEPNGNASQGTQGPGMNLVLEIALTHVRARARQTLVAVAGVATGVGFAIMMAALMEGSQDDFTRLLIDALPHITVSDERRQAPAQPAEAAFAAAEIHGLTPETRRRGIKNPL